MPLTRASSSASGPSIGVPVGGTTREMSPTLRLVAACSWPFLSAQAVAVVVSASIDSDGEGTCGFWRPRVTEATLETLSVPAAIVFGVLNVELWLVIAPSWISGLPVGASTASSSLVLSLPAWRVQPIHAGAVRPDRSSPAEARTLVP